MKNSVAAAFTAWLEGGGRRIGQVAIFSTPGGWELRHVDDADEDSASLKTATHPIDAREWAKRDDSGAFRPLKGAPTLAHGWRLILPTADAVREALDHLYPAAIGSWLRFFSGQAAAVPLRETLDRQTGMYRITALLTDEQAAEVVQRTCDLDRCCRRRIVWPLRPGVPVAGLPEEKTSIAAREGEIPILCLEGCNWLIAKARTYLKARSAAAAPASAE